MKTLRRFSLFVWAALLAAAVSGCASTYHPVGAPREGVVEQRVVIN